MSGGHILFLIIKMLKSTNEKDRESVVACWLTVPRGH